MNIKFGKKFAKQYDKVAKNIKKAVDERISLFQKNPFHPQLRNHLLTGNYQGFRSINITGDWRAIFSDEIDENGNQVIVFKLLGTHSQLYK